MNPISLRFLISSAVFTTSVLCASAQSVLFVNDNSANSSDFIAWATQSYGSGGLGFTSASYANQGTSTTTIGGDLDGAWDGGGTKKDYLNSFDLVVIQRTTSSGNFTHTADWISITSKILVLNPFVARESQLGMSNDVAGEFDVSTTGNETTVSNTSHFLFDGVTFSGSTANLLNDGNTGQVLGGTTTTFGGGLNLATILQGDPATAKASLVYFAAGAVVGSDVGGIAGTTFGGDRLFFGANNYSGISSDGLQVIRNFAAVPEPSSFAALAGLAVVGFAATRRRRA